MLNKIQELYEMMRTLYYYWLCPFSRKVRLLLAEKKLEHEIIIVKPWEISQQFLTLNPEGIPPVFIDDDGKSIAHAYPIIEYIDEVYFEPSLLGKTSTQKIEARRLIAWFDEKFYNEVTVRVLYEKTLKRRLRQGMPESTIIRQGLTYIHDHLEYISWLCDRRNWLAGNDFSLADITAAAHLSCLDYLGDVPWEKHETAKNWYARVKSRPSFRGLLQEVVPGITPSAHYNNLDF